MKAYRANLPAFIDAGRFFYFYKATHTGIGSFMSEFARFIEHTTLKPDTTLTDAQRFTEEAMRFNFAGVCIPPLYVRDCRRILGERPKVKLVTAVGFPLGYAAVSAKSDEIKRAMDEGADEINAVLNLAAVKSDLWNHVHRDIDGLLLATQSRGGVLKLMVECHLLNQKELKKVCQLAMETAVPWLVTGTGSAGSPAASETAVRTLQESAPGLKIMAAGDIAAATEIPPLVAAGAARIALYNARVVV